MRFLPNSKLFPTERLAKNMFTHDSADPLILIYKINKALSKVHGKNSTIYRGKSGAI